MNSRSRLLGCFLCLTAWTAAAEDRTSDGSGQAAETSLTVAVVSPRCAFADTDANLVHFTRFAEEAAAKGARLICFPELALTSYSTHTDLLEAAEEVPGPTTEQLAAIARRLKVFISAGMAEREGDRFHIAQVLVGPDGYLGKYRKNHPTRREQQCGFAPGQSFPTWNVDGFRLGILICFDGRHRDTLDAMKRAKVDVIHHPHGNTVGSLGRDAEEWTRSKMVYFVPRAVESRAYMIVNNSAGETAQPDRVMQYSSGALVLDPLGQVVNRTRQRDRTEKMILATLRKPVSIIPPGELKLLKAQDAVLHERFGTE